MANRTAVTNPAYFLRYSEKNSYPRHTVGPISSGRSQSIPPSAIVIMSERDLGFAMLAAALVSGHQDMPMMTARGKDGAILAATNEKLVDAQSSRSILANMRPNISQLRQAVVIAERIMALEAELATILGQSDGVSTQAPSVQQTTNPSALAKISKGRKASGASVSKSTAPVLAKRKTKLSPEGRARIVAAMKARWAAKKSSAASK